MGSWNATCAVTRLPIEFGDSVRLIMLTKTPETTARTGSPAGLLRVTDAWCPASLALAGTYADCGRASGIREDQWQAEAFLGLLRSVVAPVGEGSNPCHDLACTAEHLTDMTAVQRLCQSGGGRVFVRTSPRYAPDERLAVGYMLVLEQAWQLMTRSVADWGSTEMTPADIVADALPVCEALKQAHGKRLSPADDSIDPDHGLWPFVSRSHDGLYRMGVTLSVSLIADLLGQRLASGLTVEDPLIQEVLREMAAFSVFHRNFEAARRTYAPQLSAGQDEEWQLHKDLAMLALELSEIRLREDGGDETDTDVSHP